MLGPSGPALGRCASGMKLAALGRNGNLGGDGCTGGVEAAGDGAAGGGVADCQDVGDGGNELGSSVALSE